MPGAHATAYSGSFQDDLSQDQLPAEELCQEPPSELRQRASPIGNAETEKKA
jgi:hypothetical protein